MKLDEAKAICEFFDPFKRADSKTRCRSLQRNEVICDKKTIFLCPVMRLMRLEAGKPLEDEMESWPINRCLPSGTHCPVDNEPMFNTPNGMMCKNPHTSDEINAALAAQATLKAAEDAKITATLARDHAILTGQSLPINQMKSGFSCLQGEPCRRAPSCLNTHGDGHCSYLQNCPLTLSWPIFRQVFAKKTGKLIGFIEGSTDDVTLNVQCYKDGVVRQLPPDKLILGEHLGDSPAGLALEQQLKTADAPIELTINNQTAQPLVVTGRVTMQNQPPWDNMTGPDPFDDVLTALQPAAVASPQPTPVQTVSDASTGTQTALPTILDTAAADWTITQLDCGLDCPLKYLLKFDAQAPETNPSPVARQAVEFHRCRMLIDGGLPWTLDAAGIEVVDLIKLNAVLKLYAYAQGSKTANDHLAQIAQSEVPFRIEHHNGLIINGLIDALNADRTVIYEIIYAIDPDLYTRHLLSRMAAVYFSAIPTAQELQLIVCKKPTIRKAKDETQDAYRTRVEANVTLNSFVIKKFARQDFNVLKELNACHAIAISLNTLVNSSLITHKCDLLGCPECGYYDFCEASVLCDFTDTTGEQCEHCKVTATCSKLQEVYRGDTGSI